MVLDFCTIVPICMRLPTYICTDEFYVAPQLDSTTIGSGCLLNCGYFEPMHLAKSKLIMTINGHLEHLFCGKAFLNVYLVTVC